MMIERIFYVILYDAHRDVCHKRLMGHLFYCDWRISYFKNILNVSFNLLYFYNVFITLTFAVSRPIASGVYESIITHRGELAEIGALDLGSATVLS